MTSKRKNENDKAAKRCKVLTLSQKTEILVKLKNGTCVSSLARELAINEPNIRTIQKNEEKIQSSVKASGDTSTNVAQVSRRIP